MSEHADPRTITIWVCDECGYWRQDKSTGVHHSFIGASRDEQKRTGNRIRLHRLREATFMEADGTPSEGTG